jgi:hypothetical protein
MVTSGNTGHDRCPSQLSRAHSAPKYHLTGGDKKISKGRFGFKGESKKFWCARGRQYGDPFPADIPGMVECFEIVEVTTDYLLRGLPKKQFWVAAAPPEQASRWFWGRSWKDEPPC